jgi:large subunit ribosomal protein L10
VKLAEKKKIVADLQERFSRSKIVIVTDYKGLDVMSINALRRELNESQVEYQVVKNSLLLRASEQTDVDLIKENFKGPSAIALSYDDPVAPAKVLTSFTKKNEMLEIKAAVMNGKALDLKSIKALAALPSRDVLLGKFLSVMQGVPTALVRALDDLPRQLMNVLQAIKEQKETA